MKEEAKTKRWKMPEWMEPYRECFQNTGGNSVEELMNNHDANGFNNVILAGLIVSVDSQVTLLARLHSAGALPTDPRPITWDGKNWIRAECRGTGRKAVK